MIADLLPPRFDPLDPAVLDDPYPTYARLRRHGPLCRGGPGQYFVTRYADVSALLRDPRLGHQFPDTYYEFSLGSGAASSFFRRIILDQDPPEHTRLRRLIGRAFSPSLVRQLGAHIGELVDDLLAPVLARGRMDVVTDLAFALPITVVCELMGVPACDRELVRPHAVAIGRAFSTNLPARERGPADDAVTWLRDYVGALLTARGKAPGNDLLSSMLAAEEGGRRLGREEIVDNAVFVFFAGFETTTNLIANGFVTLLRNPAELDRLRANPLLVPKAVEEFLRYDGPIPGVARLALETIDIGGHTVRKGRVIVLLLGSANHDDRQYVAPERLDIGRDPNPHVAFGGGIHHCLGAALARMEAATAFTRLLQRFKTFELAGELVRTPRTRFRSYASVPVAVMPA
jgi:cytochrome P450